MKRKSYTDVGRVDWVQYISGDNTWKYEPTCHVHLSARMPEQLELNEKETE